MSASTNVVTKDTPSTRPNTNKNSAASRATTISRQQSELQHLEPNLISFIKTAPSIYNESLLNINYTTYYEGAAKFATN